ncbi:MAG: hypothetical protein ACFE0J_14150 [Elainellaceae cyanobacterium]
MLSFSLLAILSVTVGAAFISMGATEEIIKLFATIVTCAGCLAGLIWAPLLLKALVLVALLVAGRYGASSPKHRNLIS